MQNLSGRVFSYENVMARLAWPKLISHKKNHMHRMFLPRSTLFQKSVHPSKEITVPVDLNNFEQRFFLRGGSSELKIAFSLSFLRQNNIKGSRNFFDFVLRMTKILLIFWLL